MTTETADEKNLPEFLRNERFLAMEQVLTILYCRDVFHDFRKPVEVMYPQLAATYQSIVKRPMDLGTLLLKTKKREILTVHELRISLQLVHNNALAFNEGAPLMESISQHLEHFSSGLFEEIMRFPYQIPTGVNAKLLMRHEAFMQARLEKRCGRFAFIRDQTLDYSEIRRLLVIFNGSNEAPVPCVLKTVVEDVCVGLNNRLNKEQLTEAEIFTLRGALFPLLQAATSGGAETLVVDVGASLLASLCSAHSTSITARIPVRADCQSFLSSVGEQLGVLAVLVEERLLRGTSYSSVWATPSDKFVYAQSISANNNTVDGKNRSPWWPCMIIAGNACRTGTASAPIAADPAGGGCDDLATEPSTSHAEVVGPSGITHHMAREIFMSNLNRIPADIGKQLTKLRPRTPTHSTETPVYATSGLCVPDGYLLLEYFGAHDFGWVKCDAVFPMFSYLTTDDGTVEDVRSPPPGKLSMKDSVLEAEEAWTMLHRRRRRDGLIKRSVVRTEVAHTVGGTSGSNIVDDADEGDGVNFLPAAAMTHTVTEAVDAAVREDTEGVDLVAPPSMEELEESVEVTFSPTMFVQDADLSLSMADSPALLKHTTATATGKSKNGSRSSRKAGSEETTAQQLGAAIAAMRKGGAPPYYVPGEGGSRRSSGAGQKERDDKRALLLAAEEILRYRAEVEYVLPEDLSVDDIKRCFVDGKFHTSLCPLPLPSLSVMGSPARPDAAPLDTPMEADMITVDANTRATFRPKALMRTKALSFFLNAARPLHFEHYTATPSKKGFPPIPPSITSHSAAMHAASLAASAAVASLETSTVQSSSSNDIPALILSTVEGAGALTKEKKSADVPPQKSDKRKYVFKQKASQQSEEGEPSSTLPPIIAANIHIPANLTLSASCFMLDAGCTRYAAGEGAVYTRSVDTNSKLFHLEGRSRATRKRILQEELAGLHAAIEQLQQVSQQRQLRENDRKARFQALQQHQLEQQLHLQQQNVLAAKKQQHQMLLKMIDEQAHQRNGTGTATKKSKPKTPKVPQNGLTADAARAKQAASVAAAVSGGEAGAVDGASSIAAAAGSGAALALPKKKHRLSEGGSGSAVAADGSAAPPAKKPRSSKPTQPKPQPSPKPDNSKTGAAPSLELNALASAAVSLLEVSNLSNWEQQQQGGEGIPAGSEAMDCTATTTVD